MLPDAKKLGLPPLWISQKEWHIICGTHCDFRWMMHSESMVTSAISYSFLTKEETQKRLKNCVTCSLLLSQGCCQVTM